MKTKYMIMKILIFLFSISPIENLKNHCIFKTSDWFFKEFFPIKKVVHDTQLYMHEHGCFILDHLYLPNKNIRNHLNQGLSPY
jgi:hypothetical protein